VTSEEASVQFFIVLEFASSVQAGEFFDDGWMADPKTYRDSERLLPGGPAGDLDRRDDGVGGPRSASSRRWTSTAASSSIGVQSRLRLP
jgi:hypothetical protein